jgi:cytochrome oxidase Cu insertion factor (SCO1/SenC/PrrC family)
MRGKDLLFYLVGILAATILLLWGVVCIVFNLKATDEQSPEADERREATIKYGREVIDQLKRVFK